MGVCECLLFKAFLSWIVQNIQKSTLNVFKEVFRAVVPVSSICPSSHYAEACPAAKRRIRRKGITERKNESEYQSRFTVRKAEERGTSLGPVGYLSPL